MQGMEVLRSVPMDIALGFLSTSLLPCCLLPPLHTLARSIANPLATQRVVDTAGFVKKVQSFGHPGLLFAFALSSTTVSTESYVLLLSFLTWTGNARMAVMMAYLLALAMYFGNAMKDMVGAPRPFAIQGVPSNAKVKLQSGHSEARNAAEHGLPSTHVMNTLVSTLYLLQLGTRSWRVVTDHQALFYTGGVGWILWMAWGRMYCGMHSFLDVVAGMFTGGFLFLMFLVFEDQTLAVLQSGYCGVGKQALLAWLLLSVYPRPIRYTPSYEDVVTMMGGAFGLLLGCTILGSTHLSSNEVRDGFAGFKWDFQEVSEILVVSRRVLLGLFILFGTKITTKPVVLAAMKKFLGLFPDVVRKLWQPPIGLMYVTDAGGQSKKNESLGKKPDGTYWDVDITTRFACYTLLGVCCTLGCGLAFDFFEF